MPLKSGLYLRILLSCASNKSQMKKTILLIALALSPLFTMAQDDVIEQKIETLLTITNSRETFNNVIASMVESQKGVLADNQFLDKFKQEMYTNGYDTIHKIVLDIYKNNLSEKEIDDFIEFYQSESGQSYIEKMPSILTEAMTASENWGMALAEELTGKVEDFNEKNFNLVLEEDLSRFRTGEYKGYNNIYADISITRGEEFQIENNGVNTYKASVTWLSNNRYKLIALDFYEKEIPESTLIVNIYETTENSYKFVSKLEKYEVYLDGEVTKVE